MKRSDMVLAISKKLQKQMHLITSEIQLKHPKMLCDNLALRVITEIEKQGMLPPSYRYEDGDLGSKFINEWERE